MFGKVRKTIEQSLGLDWITLDQKFYLLFNRLKLTSAGQHMSPNFRFFSYVLYFENIFYRTMLVHSERIIYTYAFTYTCSSMVLDTLRIYYGPFSKFICWWYKFSKNFASTGLQFGFSFTILIRVRKNSYPSTGQWPNLEKK